jgi:hypothetical protein
MGPMPTLPRISADDIERWADTHYEAPAVLPRLLRRLLWATASLRRLEMPADDEVRLPGYDGICDAVLDSPHCPGGLSVWELSTEAKVEAKLGKDCDKRSADPLHVRPEITTYVAVTARRFASAKKEAWAAERSHAGPWKEVRVLSAENLAQWLEECPAVAAWFASEHLGLPGGVAYELLDIGAFIERWSGRINPPLPADLLLTGRASQSGQLRTWLESLDDGPRVLADRTLTLRAASKREALVFACATIVAAPRQHAERWLARAVVVESALAWRWIIQQPASIPMILLPSFDDFDEQIGQGPHFAVIPRDSTAPTFVTSRRVLDLSDPMPWRDVAERLRRAGLAQVDAQRVAEQSQGHLEPLLRLLGADSRLPGWVEHEDHGALVAMLLVGAWTPNNEADAAVIRGLGADPQRVDELCTRLSRTEGTPIVRRGQSWSWSSLADAWKLLLRRVPEASLQSLRAAAIEVLGEDNPKYELPSDERMLAILRRQVLSRSQELREGIAESLLELALCDDELLELFGARLGSQIAERVVNEVAKTHWKRWASMSELLPTLAEAAPNCFLNRLEKSLATEDGVVILFDQESDFFNGGGAAPHTSLLRALEILAWAPRHTAMAAKLLVRLAERDPGGLLQNGGQFASRGRLGNRPDASLAALFHLVLPQTSCEDDELQKVLDSLVKRHPALGFELLVQLSNHLRPRGNVTSARPRRRWPTYDKPNAPDPKQVKARAESAFGLLLEAAEVDAARWSRLIQLRIDLRWGQEHLSRMFDTLAKRRVEIVDPQTTIWSTIRRSLHKLYEFGDSDKQQRQIEQLHALYRDFEPDDPILRVAWQFTELYVWPEPQPRGFQEIQDALVDLRLRSLEEILRGDGASNRFLQLVECLDGVDAASRLRGLGFALAKSAHAARFEQALLLERGNPPLNGLAVPLALGAFYREGRRIEWLRRQLESWRDQSRRDEALELMLALSPDPEMWELLAEIDAELEARYWAKLPLTGKLEAEHISRALDKLFAHGNLAAALGTASFHRQILSIDDLMRTLEYVVKQRKVPTPVEPVTDAYYEVMSIFSELDERLSGDLPDEMVLRLYGLEVPFVRWFDPEEGRGARYVGRALERFPRIFVQLVQWAYLADDNEANADESIGPEEKHVAQNAGFVLESWTTYPSHDLADPVAREHRLGEWVGEVLALAMDCRRLEGAIDELGKVLARPSEADDGHWPCKIARELLESGDYLEFASALGIAKSNLRGVFMFGEDDGGKEEHELARTFTSSADALRATWPATAQVLDDLAASYTHDGDRWQRFSRENRLESGRSPKCDDANACPEGANEIDENCPRGGDP